MCEFGPPAIVTLLFFRVIENGKTMNEEGIGLSGKTRTGVDTLEYSKLQVF